MQKIKMKQVSVADNDNFVIITGVDESGQVWIIHTGQNIYDWMPIEEYSIREEQRHEG